MEETWKDIADYEGLYQVSNLGRVKSVERLCDMPVNGKGCKRRVRERILRQGHKKSQRYASVVLAKGGVNRTFSVHRLVANAFIPLQDGKDYINHIDGNGFNNCVENLEWCTQSQNVYHYTLRNRQGSDYKNVRIVQYDLDDNILQIWNSYEEIKNELKIEKTQICGCCHRRIHTAGGYKWAFEGDDPEPFKTKRIKRIIQFDSNGSPLRTYNSFKEIENTTGLSATAISSSCRCWSGRSQGFLWKVEYYAGAN